jgi:hypothetical protein
LRGAGSNSWWVLGALASALLISACDSDSDEEKNAGSAAPKQAKAEARGAGELYVQVAGRGSLRRTGGRETFELTLADLNKTVTVFTDRPARRAGVEPIESFVSKWESRGFQKDPPNAALELAHGNDKSDVKVFEISSPRLDREADTLRFTAKELGGQASSALSGVARGADRDIPAKFDRASLFIDSGATGGTPKSVRLAFTVKSEEGDASVNFDTSQVLQIITFKASQPQVTRVSSLNGNSIDLHCEPDQSPGGTCGVEVDLAVISTQSQVTGSATIDSGTVTLSGKANTGAVVPLSGGNFTLPTAP